MKLFASIIFIFVSIQLNAQKHQSTPVEFGEVLKGEIRSSTNIKPLGKYENNLIYHTPQLFSVDKFLNLNLVGDKKEYPMSSKVYRYKDVLYSIDDVNWSNNATYSIDIKKINMDKKVVKELTVPFPASKSKGNTKIIQSKEGGKIYCVSAVSLDDKDWVLSLTTFDLGDNFTYENKIVHIDLDHKFNLDINKVILHEDKLYFTAAKVISYFEPKYHDYLAVMDLKGKLLSFNKLGSEKATLLNTTISENPKSGKVVMIGLFHLNEFDKLSFNGFFTAEVDPENYEIKNVKSKPLDTKILSYLDEKFEKKGKTTIYGRYIPSIVQTKDGYYAIFEHVISSLSSLNELIVYYVDAKGDIQNMNIVSKAQNGNFKSRSSTQEFYCFLENDNLNIIYNGYKNNINATTHQDAMSGHIKPDAAILVKITPAGEIFKRVLFDYKKETKGFILKPKSIYLDKSTMSAVGAFTDGKKKEKMGKFSLAK